MITEDFHVHTTFSDGADSMAAVAEAACARGMTALGFTDHGYAPYDTACCMREDAVPAYLAECRRLRDLYAGRMAIACGVEQDLFSTADTGAFDYVIGSVHYLYLAGEYLSVDWKPDSLYRAARLLGGDMLRVAEEYFRLEATVVERTRCDLIGHFDLVAKLNDRYRLFDENDPRYVAAWRQAADALLATGVPFEINTGAIARGYRQEPYPAAPILRYLRDRGAQLVLTSDSHSRDTLMYGFDRVERACAADAIPLASGRRLLADGAGPCMNP